MKADLFTVLLALATLAVLPETARAASKAVTTADVNMRTGPGTRYGVMIVLPRGTQVRRGQCRASWCRVTLGGRAGWVSRDYLRGSQRRAGTSADQRRLSRRERRAIADSRVYQPGYVLPAYPQQSYNPPQITIREVPQMNIEPPRGVGPQYVPRAPFHHHLPHY